MPLGDFFVRVFRSLRNLDNLGEIDEESAACFGERSGDRNEGVARYCEFRRVGSWCGELDRSAEVRHGSEIVQWGPPCMGHVI